MAEIAVLTARPEMELYRGLETAADRTGRRLAVLDALALAASTTPPGVIDGDRSLDLARIGAVLPRVGNWRPDSILAVLEAMIAAGVRSLNQPAAIRRGRDHWLTAAALAGAGIPHPVTVAGADPQGLAAAAAATVGLPCVVKHRSSRQGVGVVLCRTRDHLDGVVESFWRLGEELVVQRFCPPGGRSRRVLVLDGVVLGVTEHIAEGGEFRSNAARGARVIAVAVDDAQAALAIDAARTLGLAFCGVDLFPDGDGWVVGEVNPSPGWKHFGSVSGVPVAERLVTALVRLAGEV